MAAAGDLSLPIPPHWRQGERKWRALSLYEQRYRSLPMEQRAFQPRRNRHSTEVLRQADDEFQIRGRRRYKAIGVRFWQLPPEKRAEAEAYEARLKEKWAERIRQKPNFAAILHMITINQFKNPEQLAGVRWYRPKVASRMALKAHVLRKAGLMPPKEKPAPLPPAQIHHLPL